MSNVVKVAICGTAAAAIVAGIYGYVRWGRQSKEKIFEVKFVDMSQAESAEPVTESATDVVAEQVNVAPFPG